MRWRAGSLAEVCHRREAGGRIGALPVCPRCVGATSSVIHESSSSMSELAVAGVQREYSTASGGANLVRSSLRKPAPAPSLLSSRVMALEPVVQRYVGWCASVAGWRDTLCCELLFFQWTSVADALLRLCAEGFGGEDPSAA